MYRIGVQLALSSNSAQVLGVLGRNLLGIHGQVKGLEGGFNRLKLAIGGAVAVAAGVAVFKGVGKLLSATEDLSKEQAKMYAAGLSNRNVAEATAKAWKMTATVMGTAVAENLASIGHLRAVLGDLHEAEMVAPAYQRSAVALANITGRPGEDQAYKMAQAIHQSGAANDPVTKRLRADLFERQMRIYTSMVAAGQGRLKAEDLLMFQRQAGSYGGSLNDEGRINLIGAMQSMSGQKVGTQLSSLNRAIKDGVLQKATLAEFVRVGLIDPTKVRSSSTAAHGGGASPGGGIQLLPNALTNEEQFRRDPAGWVWKTLVPKLRAAGMTTTDQQINWVQHSKLTSNPARLIAELIRNQGVDQQEARNVHQAMRVNQYSQSQRSLPAAANNLHMAFKNLMTVLGSPLVKPAINLMNGLANAMNKFTVWASQHPKIVGVLGKTVIILGAALVGIGTAAIAVAGFFAIFSGGTVMAVVAGIGGVTAAIAAFVALNWESVKSAAAAVWKFVSTIWNVASFIVQHPFKALGGLLPTGMRDVTQAEIDAANKNPWGAKDLHPGSRVFDLAPRGWSAAPPPRAANQNTTVHTQINVDGKKVAQAVSTHQARATGPGTGSGRRDPTAGIPSAAAGYRR